MPATPEFTEFIVEQMASFGPVTAKRMFGGAGLHRGGVMFALIAEDTLYLKVDGENVPAFEAEGLEAFSYTAGSGETVLMSYRRAPDRCLEDPDEMHDWCRRSFDAALRAKDAKGKSVRTRGKRSP
jgi:DNA transformation protein